MKKIATYIISLEGKDIINSQNNKKGYNTHKNNKKLFKGSLDYSLEAMKISEINDKLFWMEGKKQYTKAVINVTFKYGNGTKDINLNLETQKDVNTDKFSKLSVRCRRGDISKEQRIFTGHGTFQHKIMNTKEIREQLYINGFKLDGKEYVRFKRSSGASRVGKCLFVRKDLYKAMMDWSYMGLKYGKNDNMDLASMEAYISLTTSSIIDTMTIDPKSILVIDDYESEFKDTVMATDFIDGKLVTKPKCVNIKNSIWDGQSMMDSSLFKEKYADKGFLLTRNRFWKSACFNANIQDFFRDNNITNISQLKGFTLATDIKDIKVITTPSSIKYLKFKTHKLFKGENPYESCLKYWLENVGDVFGVVKYEKPPTNMHEMVNTHYQLINTLPLKHEEVRELLQPSLDYIKLLKDDLSVLRNHIGINLSKMEKWSLNENTTFDFVNSDEMIYKLLMINDKFAQTRMFKNYKNDLIKAYKNNIRKGHIFINGNYSTMCGNGYEMLQASCGLFNGESIQMVDEIYNTSFIFDEKLLAVRSPHVTMGNLWCCTNRDNYLISKYFNSSDYIVYVNSVKNNMLERLSGADFDSDSVLLTDNKILVDSANSIYGKFLVPTDFTPKKATTRTNSVEDKIDLDIKTSKNLIGDIINLSQILNSDYWDRVWENRDTTGLYELISQLDVLSCIEIDKAKKESVVDSDGELKNIRSGKFITYGNITRDKKIKRAMCRPYFFKFVGEGKNYKFVKKHTPMDFLEQIIDKEIPRGEVVSKDYNLVDLLIEQDNELADRKQVDKIINKITKLNSEINGIWASNMDYEEKCRYTELKKSKIVESIGSLKVSINSMYNMLYKLNKEFSNKNGELKKCGLLILNILYSSHTKEFINLIAKQSKSIEVLDEINMGEKIEVIKIYNKCYKKHVFTP